MCREGWALQFSGEEQHHPTKTPLALNEFLLEFHSPPLLGLAFLHPPLLSTRRFFHEKRALLQPREQCGRHI